MRSIKYLFRLWRKRKPSKTKSGTDKTGGPYNQVQMLSPDLSVNLKMIREKLGNSMDFIIREFNIGKTRAALVCIDGLVDKEMIESHILQPMLIYARMAEPTPVKGEKELLKFIEDNTLTVLDYQELSSLDKLLDKIFSGYTILIIDGIAVTLAIETIGYEARDVTEPETESVVRGPREGFTERLQVNIALLRRKIKSPDLRLERMTLGEVTRTDICIAYIRGIADDKIVDEVKKRLQRIEIDGILESGYIEGFIEDAPFSLFPTVGNTEKPDVLAGKLLEGRVAIFVDGSPMVLTLPYLFMENLQASEDYYSRWPSGSISRWLRFLAIFFTTLLPPLYVAVISYNPELLPTILMITVAASRAGIPFPPVLEVTLLGAIFEILREAGVRQPRPVGQAVSIVGVLVIGQAAISAGIVSAPGVMIVALTGISSFAVPAQTAAYVFIRLFLLALTATTGFFGLTIGIIILLVHLTSLRSFGVPYMSPLAPINVAGWKDLFLRAPWWAMVGRPAVIARQNRKRIGSVTMPGPPRGKAEKPLGGEDEDNA
ncbi:MAG: spore germination protein [Bacillota bacterium]|nr:spore germination protein [Bacillota bacterium]